MKTRAQNMLTLVLALIITTCLGIAITTTTANATVKYTSADSDVAQGDSIPYNTAIHSDALGGMVVKYMISGRTYAEFTVDANASITLFPEAKGYLIENWNVGEITTEASDTSVKDIITLVAVENGLTPINYTINYYDGNKLMHTDTNVTVNSKGNFYEPTKKGYKLTSWTNSSGVDTIFPGAIDTYYVITNGTSVNDYTVNLYAVWEATSTPSEDPAEPETPASDTSPATGDSTPIFLIISLIAIAGLGIIMALKRKNL